MHDCRLPGENELTKGHIQEEKRLFEGLTSGTVT